MRSISALTLLTLLCGAAPAFAQGKGKGKGGKGATPEPAAEQAPDDPNIAEAKRHMEAGAAFYNDPAGHKCEEAYREFKTAYELVGSMNALKGMGLCAMELERDGEAIAHLGKFLAAKGDTLDPADKQQMETDLKALEAAVVWVTIRSDRPGVTIIDTRTPSRGLPTTNRYIGSATGTKLGIHPGQHEFKAITDDGTEQVWRVELVNGRKYSHDFEFDKGKPVTAEGFTENDNGEKRPEEDQPKETSRPVPVSVFVLGGATLAAVAGGAIVGGMALQENANLSAKLKIYERDKGNYSAAVVKKAQAELLANRSSVVTMNAVADVCFGVAVAGAVTTAVLFVTRPNKPTEPPKSDALLFAPMVLGGGGGALVTGSF